jgi:hypothetical protein
MPAVLKGTETLIEPVSSASVGSGPSERRLGRPALRPCLPAPAPAGRPCGRRFRRSARRRRGPRPSPPARRPQAPDGPAPPPPPRPAVPGCAKQRAPSAAMVRVPDPAADAAWLAPQTGAQEVDVPPRIDRRSTADRTRGWGAHPEDGTENPRWGCLRIKGELAKLGVRVSATAIRTLLRRHGLGPTPRRSGPTWSEFCAARPPGQGVSWPPTSSPWRRRGRARRGVLRHRGPHQARPRGRSDGAS